VSRLRASQFGHQTNEGNDEFLNTLKHVRPGGGFEPASTVTVFEKGDVNGAEAQPLFKWMKSEIMIPTGGNDESCLVDTMSNGCADADALVLPRGGFGGTTVTLWTPVARSDIAWNFEKFLLDKDGKMVQVISLPPASPRILLWPPGALLSRSAAPPRSHARVSALPPREIGCAFSSPLTSCSPVRSATTATSWSETSLTTSTSSCRVSPARPRPACTSSRATRRVARAASGEPRRTALSQQGGRPLPTRGEAE
jgi:glutathione peroxidase-family protein